MKLATYSVYTRVGKSKPHILLLLGHSYKSATGGVSVAKKAMKQIMKHDPCIRKKQFYIRKHSSTVMKVYRASTKKITPKKIKFGNKVITYTKKSQAKFVGTLDEYRILSHKK